jgi:hypothetical protein
MRNQEQTWSAIGEAVATLARRISEGCGDSAFFTGQPAIAPLCDRLVQSIDDQLDLEAWIVVEASARASLRR